MMNDRTIPAVLMREHLTRVVDISRSGALIESRQRLRVGTVARLRLTFGGKECSDDVEIVRCEEMPTDSGRVYQVAVRFLWTTPPQVGTIREALTHHIEDVHTTVWVM